ncbi:26S proteasome non-ATPase regulatory subunit [Malassezia cuniculi]|uniref:26S proteasome regulatory subunit RPN3 n=1 Tax=Malassezia cuniculi TaxID=948313 RepID=A0AAF0ERX9_9BASI|nr:26S proteasome non-ATPase regulatory subunit [Malassezia cuniculi]
MSDATQDPKASLAALLAHNLSLLERAISLGEQRYIARVLRSLPYVRRALAENAQILATVVQQTLAASALKDRLLGALPKSDDAMDEDSGKAQPAAARAQAAMPEITAYLHLLVVAYALDRADYSVADELCASGISESLVQNRRSLDALCAKFVFFRGRICELNGGIARITDDLLSLQRTASLRHDAETNATVINLLLRLYIVEGNLYEQADRLVSRAPFPRQHASNPQVARYDYYVGRIRAVQLNYSDAHVHLQQAIRRAPQQAQQQPQQAHTATSAAAPKKDDKAATPARPVAGGFLQAAYKLLVIVELLMGDLPDRAIFRLPVLRRALAPYLQIVQAVRVGDLARFQTTLQTHEALFQRDKTYTLILRLRHNVIKTGIRRISLAYSRISLADITRKLHLESEEDAEYVVAKAIRDGVIDARVEHDSAMMVSNEAMDLYATNEPMAQLQQRINFCVQLHNDSVKAMRYSLDSHRAELASATAAHERERELANEIADGDMDDSEEEWA